MNNQGGLSTGDMARKVLEKEPEKLDEELKARQKELGLRDMVPTHKQDVLQQLSDIEAERHNIEDQMAKAREAREKRTAEERKAKEKSFKEKLRLYLMQKERKALDAYNRRRIVYDDFDESRIRMLSFRVLIRQRIPVHSEDELIEVPESFDRSDPYPQNDVVCVGDGVDGIETGDVVVAERYAGVEIACGNEIYRIVYDSDILFKIER